MQAAFAHFPTAALFCFTSVSLVPPGPDGFSVVCYFSRLQWFLRRPGQVFSRTSDSVPGDWTGAGGWRRKTPGQAPFPALPGPMAPSTWHHPRGPPAEVGRERWVRRSDCTRLARFLLPVGSSVDVPTRRSPRREPGREVWGSASRGACASVPGTPLPEDASFLPVYLLIQSRITSVWTRGC